MLVKGLRCGGQLYYAPGRLGSEGRGPIAGQGCHEQERGLSFLGGFQPLRLADQQEGRLSVDQWHSTGTADQRWAETLTSRITP